MSENVNNEEKKDAVESTEEVSEAAAPKHAAPEEPAEPKDETVQAAPDPEEKLDEDIKKAEDEVNRMEEETIYELQVLRETNNEENEQVVDDAEKKIREIFEELRQWIHVNSQPDKIKENLNAAREQAVDVLNSTRDKVIEISNSEDFKKAVGGIKDFLDGTGSLIAEGFQYGKEQLCKNPAIKDVFDNVDAGIDKIRENPAIHSAVEKAQDVTVSVTNSIFEGLKSFFDGTPRRSAEAPEEPKPEPQPESTEKEEPKEDGPKAE